MAKDISRRSFIRWTGASLAFPLAMLSASSFSGNQKETASQCLDRLIVENQSLIENYGGANQDGITYNLRAYEKPAGKIRIDKHGFIDVKIKVQYPWGPLRIPQNINAEFYDKQDLHIQTEGGQEFRYKKVGDLWEFGLYKGRDVGARDLAKVKTKLNGKPLNHLVNEMVNGVKVEYVNSFFFGLDYEGYIPQQELGGGLSRVNVDMKNFWLHENGIRKSLYADPDVVIGNISLLLKNNLPIIGAIGVRPKKDWISPNILESLGLDRNLTTQNLKKTNLELIIDYS